jgi:hypothetical protein
MCPYCGKHGIPVLRKAFLGPAVPTRCNQCGRLVGVPWSSFVAYLPFAAGIILAVIVGPPELKALSVLTGTSLMFLIHVLFIPLEQR